MSDKGRPDMNALTDEQLDAELARLPFPDAERGFDDAQLHRYRRGELDEAATARVEQLLLASAQARSVLAEAAAPVDDALLKRLEAVTLPPADEATVATRVGLVAVAIALAASIVAWVMRPATPDFAPRMEIVRMAGQVQTVRSGDPTLPDTPAYVPDARVRLVLGPHSDNIGAMPEVSAYRIDRDENMVPLKARITRGETGVRIEGRAGDLFGESAGEHKLHLVFWQPGTARSLAGRSADDARAAVCGSCWMTITGEIRP